ncbi:MAG: hypothetical protein F6K54_06435 [Okeania sp. SIO3B5]|uniref:hypothetical protein n=1 Tax=Okeania sp. SIO3B5 TaxID=2607811 RepID=UPI0013FEF8CD|nr:hypothetical protein [Okeania sp. SIO3B5]NEO52746.1 hypothetical protein [Okeania sp. SIO3B5]
MKKAAAKKQVSVEELASEILNEAIQNKRVEVVNISENKEEYPSNPLANKQPYLDYADPQEPAISVEDWDMETCYEEVL